MHLNIGLRGEAGGSMVGEPFVWRCLGKVLFVTNPFHGERKGYLRLRGMLSKGRLFIPLLSTVRVRHLACDVPQNCWYSKGSVFAALFCSKFSLLKFYH